MRKFKIVKDSNPSLKEKSVDVSLPLSQEDKDIFYNQCLKLNPIEFIQLTKELETLKDRFVKSSWKWICSTLGKQANWYLKNVINYHKFM